MSYAEKGIHSQLYSRILRCFDRCCTGVSDPNGMGLALDAAWDTKALADTVRSSSQDVSIDRAVAV